MSGDASPTRKRLSARAHANGVDRISNLPEQIISNILSFLPTKNAVATSVLSKTWKLRWTRLASFDVDDQLWPDWVPTIWTPKKDFVGFVKMILQNQTADSRNRFRLRCHPRRSPPKLPGELYISKHLRVLKLAGPVLIHAPNRGCLPKLAVLELDSVNYESDESFRNLILGCPMLQSLIVKRTSEKDNLVVCTISSATLKLLDVHFTFEIDDHLFDSWGVMKLQIDAPALESLLIYDVAPKQISVEKLPSLREVDLEIAYCAGDMVVDLIQAVNGVKFMTLGPSLMDTLTIAPTPNKFSATFERLTRLVVLFDPYEHWGCLADLIDCCVKLEVIELMIYKPESSEEPESEDESKDGSEDESKDGSEDESKDKFDSKGKHWMESARVPTCFSTSLRHVTMKGFYEDKGLMAMLKFFLDHGVLMERVNLCFANGNEHLDHEEMSYDDERIAFKERCRLLSKVLMLSRASPACKVNVGIS